MTLLAVGDIAPTVTLPRDGGEIVNMADFAGKNIVLYFYPRDDTPGCTKEAIGFTESVADFDALNTIVLGVSKDPIKKHDKFVAKHDLKIALLSDEEGDVCERYGVWVEKNMYGKTYMGIERATFLIGPDGVIKQAWRKVRVPGHVESVLETLRG
ncbi:thioredoxin-dependent thiol peroxidase [Loktanella sp. D2R18]|uniref:thioredoxin-dependent thiol peroxidase n=1 Tax=Rhodobacterales TaxID=204455 RepID=UPI000DEB9E19|nr:MULTISPECIES: thioredoxin-dependent thiol peroxidase [Rhodobacterales]MDO6590586.1 thioredoxin-dependent thiol peroxidase [Yoonia sp. 1_MG-2023]RBW44903.1 thioredoxin-dependent thiol peroxidase [Loktanella sp. D2R18]